MSSRSKGREVFIVDGARTPFLKAAGKPGPFPAADLALGAARPLMLRQPFEAVSFDEVILGCVMPGPDEANIARLIALRLGCGKDVPAWTVQRNCASGMQAIDCAYNNIATGRSNLVLAGGVESMSHAPVLFSLAMVNWLATWGKAKGIGQKFGALKQLSPAYFKPIIGLLRGLTDPIVGLNMGQTAEILAYRFGISRETMDAYAVDSHLRLAKAQSEGHLKEIEPLYDSRGNVYQSDDGMRADSTVEKLAKLKPVFDRDFGRVTAGNSAQVTDGAAMLILASEEAVKQYQLPVMGTGAEPDGVGASPRHGADHEPQ